MKMEKIAIPIAIILAGGLIAGDSYYDLNYEAKLNLLHCLLIRPHH